MTIPQDKADRFLPRKGSYHWKAGVGTIYEVPLPDRFAYFQIAYIDRKDPTPIVRVLAHTSKHPLVDVSALEDVPDLYYTYVGIGPRKRNTWFRKLGIMPLPVHWKDLPPFRSRHLIPDKDGKYLWRFPPPPGSKNWIIKHSADLTEEERKTPSAATPSVPLFILRLATGWSPETQVREKFLIVSAAEQRFRKRYPTFEEDFDKLMKSRWNRDA